MTTPFLSRTTLSALTLLTLGTLPLLADHSAKITLEIKTDAGKAANAEFLATQSQVLQRNDILLPVVDRLGLVEKFGKPRAEVARLLGENLKVQVSRNTSLVEVIVSQPDQNLAADIATTIVNVYRERRISDIRNSVEAQLGDLKDELDAQKAKVESDLKQAAVLRQNSKLLDPDPESGNVIITGPALDTLGALEKAADEQTVRVAQLSARTQALAKIKPEEFPATIGALQIQDPVFNRILPELAEARAEEARLLASDPPEREIQLKGLHAKMDAYAQTLRQQSESILRGQQNALQIEQDALAATKAQLDHDRENTRSSKEAILKYAEIKSAYLMAKSLLQVIQQRYAAQRFDTSIAMSSEPVKIWELPERAAK